MGTLDKSAIDVQSLGTGVIAFFFLLFLFVFSKLFRRYRANKAEGRLRLPGQEVSDRSLPDYGAIVLPRDGDYAWDLNTEHAVVEHTFTSALHRLDSTPPYFSYL